MNGTLYGADNGTGELGIIDPTNGQWTTVTSDVGRITGMAFGPIPEPGTVLLLGLGALMISRRQRS
jgi:hypothetical protein